MAIHLVSTRPYPRGLPGPRGVLGALVFVLIPFVAAAQNGYVSGQVRDAATLSALPGITINICSVSGCQSAVTQSQGYYFVTVSPGTYWVYTSNETGYTNEIYDNILCTRECSVTDAYRSGARQQVGVDIGWTVSFDLDPGARITGAITDSVTSAPLEGVEVQAWATPFGWPVQIASAQTNATGEYAIGGLPAGRYFLRTANQLGYVNEIYPNLTCPRWWTSRDVLNGQPIDLGTGAATSGRDLALDPGGRITGTVTDTQTTLGQQGVCVYAFATIAAEVFEAGSACTNASGGYELTSLPAGTYLLWSRAYQSNHIPELFDGLPCPALTCDLDAATRITVTTGGLVAGRDFSLETGGIIRGVITDALTSQPLDQALVYIGFRVAGAFVPLTVASPVPGTGEYEARGLASGAYLAFTATQRYQNEIFDDVACQAFTCTVNELSTAGTPIAVTAGLVSGGIDFGLRGDIAPGRPDAPTIDISGSTVTVSWRPPYYGGQASSYVLEAGLAPGATFVSLPTTASSYVASGVAPGIYYVRVKAVNAFGVGAASDDVEVIVTGAGASPLPGKPGYLQGWMSGSRLTLMWEAPLSGSSPITGYVVEAGSGPGLTDIAAIGVNARALTFVPVPAGFYFVRVRAMNSSGLGPVSNEIIINSGFVPSPPGPPWLEPPVVSGNAVTLSWDVPEVGPAATSYVVRAGSATGLSNLAEANVGPGTTATFTTVPPGRYFVRVHGTNAAGLGLASNEVLVIVR